MEDGLPGTSENWWPGQPCRGFVGIEIGCALKSMMARSDTLLHNEAGYIDARPPNQIIEPSCNARPDHTSGSISAVTRLCSSRVRNGRGMWPRPGSDTPVHNVSYATKVGDLVCGVAYYK